MANENTLKQLTPDATLRQILSADKQAGGLLASIGLKASSYKDETLRSVCQQRQWSEEEVLQWLKNQTPQNNGSSEEETNPKRPMANDELTEWCDYLEKTYLRPAFDLLKSIKGKFPRVKKIHGNQYPWLKNIQWRFEQFDEDLRLYLTFESEKVFPLARKIDETKQQVLDGTVRNLRRSREIIVQDQRRLRDDLKTIRKKGNNFRNPGGACSTFRILNHQFRQLDTLLDKQFELERGQILPLMDQRLDEI